MLLSERLIHISPSLPWNLADEPAIVLIFAATTSKPCISYTYFELSFSLNKQNVDNQSVRCNLYLPGLCLLVNQLESVIPEGDATGTFQNKTTKKT